MEKKSNSTSSRSSSTICSRIRQALASYPAFRAIHRINQYSNKPQTPYNTNKPITITTNSHSNNPSSCSSNPSPNNKHIAKNTASTFQSNPPLPQHVKVMNTQGRGEGAFIPINFDYSTTNTPSLSKGNNNRNSSTSSISKVASPHNIKVEPRNGHHHHGHGMQQQQQQQQQEGGKKSLDINDTFAEYIQRTMKYIKSSTSDVGRSQGNSAPTDHVANGVVGANNTNAIKMENQKDPFSDYIQRAGKRLRTTSNVAKAGGSFRRG